MEEDTIPLSQLANDAFNPVRPHQAPVAVGGATDFAGLTASLNGGSRAASVEAAGPGPSSIAAQQQATKHGKLFQVRRWLAGWLERVPCPPLPLAPPPPLLSLPLPQPLAKVGSCSPAPGQTRSNPVKPGQPCRRTRSTAASAWTPSPPSYLTAASSSACAASSSWA